MTTTDKLNEDQLLELLEKEEKNETTNEPPTTPTEQPETKPEDVILPTERPEERKETLSEGTEARETTPEATAQPTEASNKPPETTTQPPVEEIKPETKTETRGRKKLKRDETGNIVRPERSEYKTAQQILSEQPTAAAPITTQQPTAATQQQKVDISQYISGALALLLIDLFFPSVIAFGYNKFVAARFDKDQIKAGELKLTAKEQKELEPLADACIKEMMFQLSPTKALIIALSIIYGGKVLMISQADEI